MDQPQRPQDTRWWRWFVAPAIVGGLFAAVHVPVALPFVVAGFLWWRKWESTRSRVWRTKKPSKSNAISSWTDDTWWDSYH